MAKEDGKDDGPVGGNGSEGGKDGVRDKEQINSKDKPEGHAFFREDAFGIQGGNKVWESMITNHFVNGLSFWCMEANVMGMPMINASSLGLSFFIRVFESSLEGEVSNDEKKKTLHDIIEKYFLSVKPAAGNA